MLRNACVCVYAFSCECTWCMKKKAPQSNGDRVGCLGDSAGKTGDLHGEKVSWIPNTINKGELQMH